MTYIDVRRLAERYGISVATVWRWARTGLLPPPIQLSPGTTRWRLDEIEKRDAERAS